MNTSNTKRTALQSTSLSTFVHILIIALICFSANHHALAKDQQPEKPWTGTLGDGTIIDEADLKEIIRLHQPFFSICGLLSFLDHQRSIFAG